VKILGRKSAFPLGLNVNKVNKIKRRTYMIISFGENKFTFDSPVTVYEAAQAAGLISREVICARVNGEACELTRALCEDAEVELLTFADTDGKKVFWHTSSHILAQAVKRLYPEQN
jgi:threonyl-tRNA synthetase